jgi:hypothetical protein
MVTKDKPSKYTKGKSKKDAYASSGKGDGYASVTSKKKSPKKKK